MADGGYFKGTSADQDNRFADKRRKLMRSMKFGEGLDRKIDISKVNIDVIKPWITKRVTEMLGIEDDVVIGYIFNQLDERYPDAKEMQINLTGFLNAKNSRILLSELWNYLFSAMESPSGIPAEFVEQKKEEIKKRQAEMDLIQENKRKIEEQVSRAEYRELNSFVRRRDASPRRSSFSGPLKKNEAATVQEAQVSPADHHNSQSACDVPSAKNGLNENVQSVDIEERESVTDKPKRKRSRSLSSPRDRPCRRSPRSYDRRRSASRSKSGVHRQHKRKSSRSRGRSPIDPLPRRKRPSAKNGLNENVQSLDVEQRRRVTNKTKRKRSRSVSSSRDRPCRRSRSRSYDRRRSRSRSRAHRKHKHKSSASRGRSPIDPLRRRKRRSSSNSASPGDKLNDPGLDSEEEAPKLKRRYRKKHADSTDRECQDLRDKRSYRPGRNGPSPIRYGSSSPRRRRSEYRSSPFSRQRRSPARSPQRNEHSRPDRKPRHSPRGRPAAKANTRTQSSSSPEEIQRRVHKCDTPPRFAVRSPPDAWRRNPRTKNKYVSPRRMQAMAEMSSSDETHVSTGSESSDEDRQLEKDRKSAMKKKRHSASPLPKKSSHTKRSPRQHSPRQKQDVRRVSESSPEEVRRVIRKPPRSLQPRRRDANSSTDRGNSRRHSSTPPSRKRKSSHSVSRGGEVQHQSPSGSTSPERTECGPSPRYDEREERISITRRVTEQPVDKLQKLRGQRSSSHEKKLRVPMESPSKKHLQVSRNINSPPRRKYPTAGRSSGCSDSETQPSKRLPSPYNISDVETRKKKIKRNERNKEKEKKHKKHKKQRHQKRKEKGSEGDSAASSLDELRREALSSMKSN